MTKNQRKAEIASCVVADDICSEEEVGLDVDAAVVPPMKESWEPVELKIYVLYGPRASEACRLELAFFSSNGEAADRPAKSRLEARKKKMQFDTKHKKLKDPRTP
jgi:hypothetical protein